MSFEDHAIITGPDGVLDRSTPDDVRRIVTTITDAERAVLHLHGGLVSEQGAMRTVEQLAPIYLSQGASSPAFMVYRTGFLEIVGGHLGQISRESLFQSLLGKVLKFAYGKLTTADPAKSLGTADLPRDREVRRELHRARRDEEPFGALEPVQPAPLADEEADRFARELEADDEFQDACRAIAAAVVPESEREESGARGVTTTRAAPETLLSPDVVDELAGDSHKGTRGLLSTATIVARSVNILRRVVARYLAGRDHGLYPTCVEELFRELYLANVGAAVWQVMKTETGDTFETGDSPRGGRTFVRELGERVAAGKRPALSVVAHSLGSVYACRLIQHLAACREDPAHPLPADFAIENLVFLAPAVDYGLFADVLDRHRGLFRDFRMFALEDGLEAGYWEVPGVYPRSLLYLVSGVFENELSGESAADLPLLGMKRYFAREDVYDSRDVAVVRRFLAESPRHLVWSVADGGPGFASSSKKHGAFDDPPPGDDTILNVCVMLRG